MRKRGQATTRHARQVDALAASKLQVDAAARASLDQLLMSLAADLEKLRQDPQGAQSGHSWCVWKG